jgi:phage terminase large subunit
LGAGVVDRLRELGHTVFAVKAGQRAHDDKVYVNLRAEMWAKCRDWLIESGHIPDSPALINDLTSPMYSYDSAGRMQIEKKSDMKKRGLDSPDCAESLVHTFAFPVAAKAFRSGKPTVLQTDYDIFRPIHEQGHQLKTDYDIFEGM